MRLTPEARFDIHLSTLRIGRNVCFLGGSPPPPPDYSSTAAATQYAADMAYKSASEQMAFQRQVYDDNKPMVAQARAAMARQADQQYAMTAQAQLQAADSWDTYNKYGKPLEAEMATNAQNAGSVAQQDVAAGRAVTDVNQQSANQRDQMNRSMSSMGVNPNSGRFAAMNNANAINSAAMAAGGATNARTQAYNQGMATKAGAAGYFSGKGTSALQGVQVATSAGAAGNAAMSGAATASLAGAQMMNTGFAGQQSAAGVGMQGAMNQANMLNNSYQNQMSAYNADQAATGQLFQAAGMVAGMKF
jgi:hypothetical protein